MSPLIPAALWKISFGPRSKNSFFTPVNHKNDLNMFLEIFNELITFLSQHSHNQSIINITIIYSDDKI